MRQAEFDMPAGVAYNGYILSGSKNVVYVLVGQTRMSLPDVRGSINGQT